MMTLVLAETFGGGGVVNGCDSLAGSWGRMIARA
jgi:hypothetical protein